MRGFYSSKKRVLLKWHHLRSRRFSQWKFRRQVPMDSYILDFVCFSARLIIEIDGSQHGEPTEQVFDQERTHFLKQHGFRVVRFWNNDVLSRTELVLENIFNALI
jgi:very-short-patch-repair endonuclease